MSKVGLVDPFFDLKIDLDLHSCNRLLLDSKKLNAEVLNRQNLNKCKNLKISSYKNTFSYEESFQIVNINKLFICLDSILSVSKNTNISLYKFDCKNFIKNLTEIYKTNSYKQFYKFHKENKFKFIYDFDYLLKCENFFSKLPNCEKKSKNLIIGDDYVYSYANKNDDVLNLGKVFLNDILKKGIKPFLKNYIKDYESITLALGTYDILENFNEISHQAISFSQKYLNELKIFKKENNIKIKVCLPLPHYSYNELQKNFISDMISEFDRWHYSFQIVCFPFFWLSLSKKEFISQISAKDDKNFISPKNYNSEIGW